MALNQRLEGGKLDPEWLPLAATTAHVELNEDVRVLLPNLEHLSAPAQQAEAA